MSHLQLKASVDALATLVSAVIGSALFMLLLFYWPRPIIVWMRVIVPQLLDPVPATGVALVAVIVALLLAVAALGARWLLRRLGVCRPATALALLLVSAFALSFGLEATSQVVRASGNLTASDATGPIIDGARLTAHGWETIARRAAVAALYTGLMATSFWFVRLAMRAETRRS
jgi:hypothetical protein